MRFGIRPPLTAGLLMAAASLALFSRAPVGGSFLIDVLPSMVLLGIGAGIAFNPVLLAAMGDVEPHESGLASGVVNTSFMMGGALGLAVLVSISTARTDSLLADGAASRSRRSTAGSRRPSRSARSSPCSPRSSAAPSSGPSRWPAWTRSRRHSPRTPSQSDRWPVDSVRRDELLIRDVDLVRCPCGVDVFAADSRDVGRAGIEPATEGL